MATAVTKVPTIWTPGASSPWLLGYDLDLTAQGTSVLDRTAATITLAGQTWSQIGGTTYLDSLDLTSGTGLVANHSITSGAVDLEPGSMWYIHIPVVTLIPAFTQEMRFVVGAVMGAPGGNVLSSSANGGIFASMDITAGSTDWATLIGIGGSASFSTGRNTFRQQGTGATGLLVQNNATDNYRALSVEVAHFGTMPRFGTADGVNYPALWEDQIAGQTGWQFGAATTMRVGMFSQAARTDGTFVTTLKRFSVWYDPTTRWETP